LEVGVAFHGSASPVGDWSSLAARLELTGVWTAWRRCEPALRTVEELAALPAHTLGCDPAAANDVLTALARWAAQDGGDDPRAAVVLVHVLAPGVRQLARSLPGAPRDALGLVVGELVAQIRRRPSTRGLTGSVAVSLLRSTRRELLRELPRRAADGALVEVPVASDHPVWDRCEHPGAPAVNLAEVLRWAVDAGVASVGDVALLVTAAQPGGRLRAAATLGVTERTVRRRRDSMLTRLRVCAPRFWREQVAA
jgi:hypothetical protein